MMIARHKKILNALIISTVLFLSYQNVFWVTFNPFQSGVDELELDQKISMMLEESDETVPDRASLHLGMPHHTNIPRNHGNKPFCLAWRPEDALNRTLQSFDEWWTHHPTWVISKETDDMFCVEPGRDAATMEAFQKFYNTQFKTGCERIHWRVMWSSGWGADMMNVQCGLIESTNKLHIPLVMGLWYPWDDRRDWERGVWHYAANKDDHTNKTCHQADMTCYFLPYHNCGSLDEMWKHANRFKFVQNEEVPEEGEIYTKTGREANAFLTRRQLWLRRAVYDFKRKFKSRYEAETDCSVIHVRRSDVVLHDEWSRKYFPVMDYVQLIPRQRLRNPNHTIFLLTDDANAIDEAHEFHPELRWKYFNRTRYRGTSGGWEHQTPSNNPANEVITLLATFDLVKECSLLVHGQSKFSEMLWFMMAENKDAMQRRVDQNTEIYSTNNNASEFELLQRLNAMRRGPSDTKSIASTNVGSSTSSIVNTTGLIIVNILGLLANDLFEAAFAARMADQLGWRVVYRTMWNPAWPTKKTDFCFPNVKRDVVEEREKFGDGDPLWMFLKEHSSGHNRYLQKLYEAVTYVDMDENSGKQFVTDNEMANQMHLNWIKGLGEKAKTIKHLEYPLQGFHVDQLVEELKSPRSQVKVLNLEAFFIHFDWMKDWMGPQHIPHWLKINQDSKCCPTPSPKKDTIVIHIRDFNPEDDDKNKNLQVGVFRDIIHKYYKKRRHEVWVVCQPKSVTSKVVQDLVKEFKAQVHTGTDNIDAFCILARARIHIPTTSSSFSQMAALLAESHIKETYSDQHVEVHYPTHTLNYPMVTLKVPGWKYHLTNDDCTGIEEFDVDQTRLEVTQA